MKKLFYAVCMGSLALAVSASAADNNNRLLRKGRGTQKASTTQGASVRNTSQVNVLRHANGARLQQRSLATARHHAVIQQRRSRNHDFSGTGQQNHLTQTGVRHHRVDNVGRNFGVHHSNNMALNRHRNVTVNRQRNVTVNRRRNVTINNNWRGSHFRGRQYAAFRNYHREWHNRNWWRSHHTRIIFVSGGWYCWNLGYWYPAWGYDPGYYYPYDGPIYGYNSLAPDQVVVNVQAQLQRDGYYSGPVDGVLGPMTRQAIADFQADHGLAITSAVDEPTLASLGLV